MTTPYTVHTGDCRDVLRDYPADHFDSIVSDPPYGLTFMGKGWDRGVPGVEFWQEALRVAKPGAHLLAFGGTRTFHRLTVAIEDAGWEIRDCMMWLYGSGFPKSHDVSKAIDRAVGAERQVLDERPAYGIGSTGATFNGHAEGATAKTTAPATPEAKQWEGWGTALKPAWEPVIVARKPLSGTVADNVLRYGTGALNIDGCRVGSGEDVVTFDRAPRTTAGGLYDLGTVVGVRQSTQGRWPANVMHDGSAEVVAGFPVTAAAQASMRGERSGVVMDADWGGPNTLRGHNDAGGSAARFFYCAKASRTDRDEGCDNLPGFQGHEVVDRKEGSAGLNSPRAGAGRTISNVREFGGAQHTEDVKLAKNFHPTVKPTDLMRYLCRLVTPPAGLVLDPFCGSGSTGKAALLEGLRFVGVDLDPAHVAIAEARCQFAVDTVAEQAAAAEAPGAQLTLF
jgi:site-specific DNA-methyltransferase (adenine-specific)